MVFPNSITYYCGYYKLATSILLILLLFIEYFLVISTAQTSFPI